MTAKIYKQLATKQDLAIGEGKVTQSRNGVDIELDEIDFVSGGTGGKYFVRDLTTITEALNSTALVVGDALNILEDNATWGVSLLSSVTLREDDILACTNGLIPAQALVRRNKGTNEDFQTVEQLTKYTMTDNRHIFGQEYTWPLINGILLNQNAANVEFIWSGDSTTAGTNAGSNTVDYLGSLYANTFGLGKHSHINAGHGGQSAVLWNTFYLPQDIIDNPDMDVYITRWGINDGTEHGDVATYIQNMDEGLAQLRAFKDIHDLTIVVMAPNSVYDDPNNRGTDWFEQIVPELRKLCRKYMCVFIDTYSLWQDARQGALAGDPRWMDDPFGDGRGIHPDGAFNHLIIHKTMEMLLAPIQRIGLQVNSFTNSQAAEFKPLASQQPTIFSSGLHFYDVLASDGWPSDGKLEVKTFGQKVIQRLYYRAPDAVQDNPFVLSIVRIGDKSQTWSDWLGLPIDITGFINGWSATTSGAKYIHHENGQVQLIGEITGGAANTEAFILPIKLRPTQVRRFASVNAALAFATVQVKPSGAIEPRDTHIFLDGIVFKTGT